MIMNSAIGNLVEKFFHVNTLEEVEESAIEQLAGKYPYYAPLQYLLARKYRQMDALLYRLQITKTAVFFSNPHWLNDLLQNDQESEPPEDPDPTVDESLNKPVQGVDAVENDGEVQQMEVEIEEAGSEPETAISEASSPDTDNDPLELQVKEAEEKPISEEVPDDSSAVDTDFQRDNDNQSFTVKSVAPFTEPGLIQTPVLTFPASEDPLPVLPVEPLFTIDYFASQGIRWNNEEGNDQLSKKLRSFTEWLKTMKRLHPEKLEQEMDKGRDGAIQDIAEHSNELDEVVTEAMAEVFARQGMGAKAIEVYQKLSLLNPNKRAYFAARISKLNPS